MSNNFTWKILGFLIIVEIDIYVKTFVHLVQ